MNRRETLDALDALGMRASRGMGQNFLVNPLTSARIAAAVGEGPLRILEIGPGLGALTEALLGAGHQVTAVELSIPLAGRMSREYPEVTTVQGDFLDTDPRDLPGFPFSAVASNLPYSISSQAVLKLCEDGFATVRKAVLMLQKEMAERLACLDGGKNYGRLSLMVWPWFRVNTLFDLGPEEFVPRPAVDSSVVVLERRDDPPLDRKGYAVYRRIVRAAFSSRRKKVINCLASLLGREGAERLLASAMVDRDLRAERIPPEKFVELAGKAEF